MGRYHDLHDLGEPARPALLGAWQIVVTAVASTHLTVRLINGPFGDHSAHRVDYWPLKLPEPAVGDKGVALFDETEQAHIVSWFVHGWGESQSHPAGDTRP